MKKRMLAMLLVVVLVFAMIPAAAAAETGAPEIKKVNMTLGGILGVNFKVDAKGTDMSGYSLRVTVGDAPVQSITGYTMDGSLYVYTAKLPAHRLGQSLKVELLSGDTVVQTQNDWTVQSYLSDLVSYNPENAELAALAAALQNYGAYAAYYADATGTQPNVAAVEAVKQADLAGYKHKIITSAPAGLGAVTALYLDDACDLQIKFNVSAWDGKTLYVDGKAVPIDQSGEKVVYKVTELLPQDWGKSYIVKVVDAAGSTVMEYTYCAMSHAYAVLGKTVEQTPGLQGLMKAMYLYQKAAVAYLENDDVLIENGPIDEGDGPVIEF